MRREDKVAETILCDRTRRRIDIGDADEGGGGSTVLSKFSNPPLIELSATTWIQAST